MKLKLRLATLVIFVVLLVGAPLAAARGTAGTNGPVSVLGPYGFCIRLFSTMNPICI